MIGPKMISGMISHELEGALFFRASCLVHQKMLFSDIMYSTVPDHMYMID